METIDNIIKDEIIITLNNKECETLLNVLYRIEDTPGLQHILKRMRLKIKDQYNENKFLQEMRYRNMEVINGNN